MDSYGLITVLDELPDNIACYTGIDEPGSPLRSLTYVLGFWLSHRLFLMPAI